MGKRIGYAKLGRSMPLTLEKCGTLGGDIEMTAALTTLADRRPDDTFVLIGRNSGDDPQSALGRSNIENPWINWADEVRSFQRRLRDNDRGAGGLSVPQQQELVKFMDQLVGPTFDGLDEIVMWIGQHGTSNSPIPKVEDRSLLTKPQDWSIYYASFLLNGINRWRDADPWNREEINLNADPRNRHKMRDLKWPLRHPVLTQFDFVSNIKHERYGDASDWEWWSGHGLVGGIRRPEDVEQVWESTVRNVYSRIELNALVPGTPSGDLLTFNDTWDDRTHFGIIINEARAIGVRYEMSRLHAMQNWVMPLMPAFVHGTWSPKSLTELQTQWPRAHSIAGGISPIDWMHYVPKLVSTRCTLTTPSSGSGWATTKPWEAFGAGVVCFFHPQYDTQNNILKDAHPNLQEWLRVDTPSALKMRVDHLSSLSGRSDWEWLVHEQRRHFVKAMSDLTYVQMINDRLDGVGK